MTDTFTLTSPGASETDAHFAAELLATLQARSKEFDRTRPTLVAWSLCMPVGLHRQLRKAAKKHDLGMTEIVIEALRRTLPVLLSEDELTRAAGSDKD